MFRAACDNSVTTSQPASPPTANLAISKCPSGQARFAANQTTRVEGCRHIVNAYDTAIEEQNPIVGIWHSGGARLTEGVRALHAVGLVFEAMIRASRYIPQISVVVGFAAGGAAYGPAEPGVRHRARRGAKRDRRGRRHGVAGRTGHPPQEVGRLPHRGRR